MSVDSPILVVSHIGKRYGEKVTVDDVSFNFIAAKSWACSLLLPAAFTTAGFRLRGQPEGITQVTAFVMVSFTTEYR